MWPKAIVWDIGGRASIRKTWGHKAASVVTRAPAAHQPTPHRRCVHLEHLGHKFMSEGNSCCREARPDDASCKARSCFKAEPTQVSVALSHCCWHLCGGTHLLLCKIRQVHFVKDKQMRLQTK